MEGKTETRRKKKYYYSYASLKLRRSREGKCIRCCNPMVDDRFVQCEDCRKKIKRKRIERGLAGLCSQCGKKCERQCVQCDSCLKKCRDAYHLKRRQLNGSVA